MAAAGHPHPQRPLLSPGQQAERDWAGVLGQGLGPWGRSGDGDPQPQHGSRRRSLSGRSTGGAGWSSGNPPAKGPSAWRSTRMRRRRACAGAPRWGAAGGSGAGVLPAGGAPRAGAGPSLTELAGMELGGVTPCALVGDAAGSGCSRG